MGWDRPGRGRRKGAGRGAAGLLLLLGILCTVWAGEAAGNAGYNWEAVLRQADERTGLESHLLRAIAYVNLGRVEDGLREFDTMAQADFRPFARETISRLEKEVVARPDDLVALNGLAFANYALDRYDESIRWYERILEVDPENVWIRHYTALAYQKLGRLDDAVGILEDALSLDPKNQYTHLLLGLAYYEMKNYTGAFVHMLQAPEAIRTMRRLKL